jgi:hypothetical protein
LRLRADFDTAASFHRKALAYETLTDSQILFVRHRLAKALEAYGEYAAAERELTEVHGDGTLLPEVIRKDHARLTLFRGNPAPALAWARDHVESDVPTQRAQAWGLLGRVRWFSGDFNGAEQHFRRILDDPELARAGLSRTTGARNIALTVCWTRPVEGLQRAREAFEINAEAGEVIGEAQALVAMAIAKTGSSSREEIERELTMAAERFKKADDKPEIYFVMLARLFSACVAMDHTAAARDESALLDHLNRYPLVPYLREAASVWLRRLNPERSVVDSEAKWPDRTAALAAWHDVLELRLAGQ